MNPFSRIEYALLVKKRFKVNPKPYASVPESDAFCISSFANANFPKGIAYFSLLV
jgi:hypothetical protein